MMDLASFYFSCNISMYSSFLYTHHLTCIFQCDFHSTHVFLTLMYSVPHTVLLVTGRDNLSWFLTAAGPVLWQAHMWIHQLHYKGMRDIESSRGKKFLEESQIFPMKLLRYVTTLHKCSAPWKSQTHHGELDFAYVCIDVINIFPWTVKSLTDSSQDLESFVQEKAGIVFYLFKAAVNTCMQVFVCT